MSRAAIPIYRAMAGAADVEYRTILPLPNAYSPRPRSSRFRLTGYTQDLTGVVYRR